MKTDLKKDNFKLLKIILGVIWGVSIIWIIYTASKEEGSILLPIIISAILLISLVVAHFGKKFSELSKKSLKDLIPNPIERQEVLDLVKIVIEGTAENDYKDGYFRNIKEFDEIISKDVNKQQIYAVKVILSYKRKIGKEELDKLWIIVNATYPKIIPSVKNGNILEEEIKEEMDLKTKADPKAEPIEKVEVLENEMTGIKKSTVTKTPQTEVKKEEETVV